MRSIPRKKTLNQPRTLDIKRHDEPDTYGAPVKSPLTNTLYWGPLLFHTVIDRQWLCRTDNTMVGEVHPSANADIIIYPALWFYYWLYHLFPFFSTSFLCIIVSTFFSTLVEYVFLNTKMKVQRWDEEKIPDNQQATATNSSSGWTVAPRKGQHLENVVLCHVGIVPKIIVIRLHSWLTKHKPGSRRPSNIP